MLIINKISVQDVKEGEGHNTTFSSNLYALNAI